MVDHETIFANARTLIRSLEATQIDDVQRTYDEYIALFSNVESMHCELKPLYRRPEISSRAVMLDRKLVDAWHRVQTLYNDARRRAAEGGPP